VEFIIINKRILIFQYKFKGYIGLSKDVYEFRTGFGLIRG